MPLPGEPLRVELIDHCAWYEAAISDLPGCQLDSGDFVRVVRLSNPDVTQHHKAKGTYRFRNEACGVARHPAPLEPGAGKVLRATIRLPGLRALVALVS